MAGRIPIYRRVGDVLPMRPGKADRGICTSCHRMPSRALPPATAQLDGGWMIAGSLGCGDSGVVSTAIQGASGSASRIACIWAASRPW